MQNEQNERLRRYTAGNVISLQHRELNTRFHSRINVESWEGTLASQQPEDREKWSAVAYRSANLAYLVRSRSRRHAVCKIHIHTER